MKRKEPEQLYQELFPSEREKAAAFDRIAQEYYFRNFGEMAKADLESGVKGRELLSQNGVFEMEHTNKYGVYLLEF